MRSLSEIDPDALSPAARFVFDEILWQHAVDETPLADVAGRLRLTPGEVRDAIEFFGCEVEASLGGATLPELDRAAYEALRDDIAERGQLTPILVDAAGEIVDGRNRMRVCHELAIEPVSHQVDADGREAGLAANLNRRQLSGAQKRRVIRIELLKDGDRPDRQIARMVGVGHQLVGAVRRELAQLRGRLDDSSRPELAPAQAAQPTVRVDESEYLALVELAHRAAAYYAAHGGRHRDAALEEALGRWEQTGARPLAEVA